MAMYWNLIEPYYFVALGVFASALIVYFTRQRGA
jgi:hypothetical protein